MSGDRLWRRKICRRFALPCVVLLIFTVGNSVPAIAVCRESKPTIIDLGAEKGRTFFEFAEGEDVIFLGDDEVRRKILRVEGGRDVTILGGDFLPEPAESAATINVQGITGDLLIKGTRVDNSLTGERDGIAVAGLEGHSPAVVIRDTRVVNVQGSFEGTHGDIFQAYGPIVSLTVERFTGSTSYQGFFLDPQHEPLPKRVRLRDVNLRPNFSKATDLQPKLLWFFAADAPATYPVELTNVRIDGRTVHEASGNLFPPDALIEQGGLAWPNLPIEGMVKVGVPQDVDFAERDAVGRFFDAQVALDRLSKQCPR